MYYKTVLLGNENVKLKPHLKQIKRGERVGERAMGFIFCDSLTFGRSGLIRVWTRTKETKIQTQFQNHGCYMYFMNCAWNSIYCIWSQFISSSRTVQLSLRSYLKGKSQTQTKYLGALTLSRMKHTGLNPVKIPFDFPLFRKWKFSKNWRKQKNKLVNVSLAAVPDVDKESSHVF